MSADPRYPYTRAYDYIRMQTTEHSAEHDMKLPCFSRSECSRICSAIAPALGLTAEALAIRIADYAKASGEEA